MTTILVVDDEPNITELARLYLEREGYKVESASRGSEALTKLDATKPALVVLDLMLPGMDGIEAIRLYTQHLDEISLVFTDLGLPRMDGATAFLALREINPSIKAVFASGFLDLKARAELSEAHAKAFVEKPYNPKEVLRMIREVLDGPS